METTTKLLNLKFDSQLEMVARQFMPERRVVCGDVVMTLIHETKKMRPVVIYEVGFRVVGRNDIRPRRSNESYSDWRLDVNSLGIDFYFYALRLDKDFIPKDKIGSGINLTNLTKDSYTWNELHKDFNHIGLQWPFEKLVNIPSPKQIKEAYECLQTAS